MMIAARAEGHVTLDEKGIARIDNTRMKVIHVAANKRYHDATPEQMRESWPHLSLAQIHAALAYYYDHQEALDLEMDRNAELAEQLRAVLPRSAAVQALRERAGELP